MATAGDGNSPMDSNNTPKAIAMPFTLMKLAYFACDPKSREFYNTKSFGVRVDLQECCKFLMAPGDKQQVSRPKYDDDNITDVCSVAAFNGHLDCLKQAHVAGIPWNWRTTEVACRSGHIECLMYVHSNGCETGGYVSALAAACAGNIGTLEYAWIHKFKFPHNLCTLIARFGSIESLRYLRSLGFSWNTSTAAEAARFNQLEFLKYLHQHGCPWDATTCYLAAQNGNLECLKYAHTNGCEWDMRTCHGAAQFGYIRCLKYAHSNGCEWNILTTLMAAINKQHRCFRYAIRNGCPWPTWLTWESLSERIQ
ncbi:uncharacterized protein LOC132951864 [Metopolophium dirhodum]|uniref:uncharacterized protein LOC132951864 n=1 Tax=Metopolophium dirhodum TaxID=44670 RepID=UPI00299056A5|nr:uncharacterized protein LOC132951864 [Metopolophium dirhodum]